MKTKNALYLLLVSIMFIVTGCNGGRAGVTAPKPSVTIVKFKDPAYTKNVIVWGNDKTNTFSLMRGNECEHTYWMCYPERERDGSLLGATNEVKFPERYRDPFWALPDGWYLIDWAWGNLSSQAYPYIGHTILTEVTFDNLYDYETCNFDKSMSHITMPRDEIFITKDINIGDLMAYIHPDGNYPSFELRVGDVVYTTASNQYFFHELLKRRPVASNVSTCYCGLADQMDEYWAVLQNQLTTLINNGDLDKLKHFDTNILYLEQ